MFPTFSPDNVVGVSNRYAIAFANVPQNQTAGTNCQNVGLGEFRFPVTPAQRPGSMTHLILCILFRCRPAKVSGSVVVDVAIPMCDLMIWRRLFSVKGRTNNNTNSSASGGSKIENVIFPALHNGFQHDAGKETLPTEFVDNPSIHRSYAAQTRCLIVRMVRHRAPFFGFFRMASRRIVSFCGSRHMLPHKTVANGLNGAARYAEPLSYRGDVPAIGVGRAQSTDFPDIGLSEFCTVRPLTEEPCAMTGLVKAVGGYRGPSQVIGAVIAAVAIVVCDYVSSGRSRSVERCANQSVNELTDKRRAFVHLNWQDDEGKRRAIPRGWLKCLYPFQRDAYRQIWSTSIRFKNPAAMGDKSTLCCENKAVHRSNPSEARCLVTETGRNWTPFFDFCYRIISHCALSRSKMVRGWRRGERLSSVPYHNELALPFQAGITLLAART